MPHLDLGILSLAPGVPLSWHSLLCFEHLLFNQAPPLGCEFFEQELWGSSRGP